LPKCDVFTSLDSYAVFEFASSITVSSVVKDDLNPFYFE